MADVRVSMSDKVADKFYQVAGLTPEETLTEAVNFYAWCVEQTAQGRTILTANPDGSAMKRLDYAPLNRARPQL